MTNVRRLATSACLAGAAVAAAVIGTVGMPAARADVIDDLLMQAEGDLNDAATLISGVDTSALSAQQIAAGVSAFQGEAGLISQIQTQQDGLAETLQSGSQLVSADNQLASASGDLLTAVNAYVNAADAGDYATGASFSGELTGYFDRLDLAYAEVFQFLPAALNAEFATLFVGFPNVEPITAPTDLAAGADSAAAIAAAVSGNQYDPAVFDYSADPTNLFSPVYSIQPVGPEDVTVTDASGDVFGAQDFSVTEFGFPVDTFTGNVEYSPVSSPLDIFGSPYVEDINVAGVPGTVVPENTGFLVTEFGGGWGNVMDVAMNSTGTSDTVGDFLMTPFGTENITPIVDFLLNYTGTLPDATSVVDPSSFVDLLSSIGL